MLRIPNSIFPAHIRYNNPPNMKKNVARILIILGGAGLFKSTPSIIEYYRFTHTLSPEERLYLTGLLPLDFGQALLSLILLIIGFYLLKRKADRLKPSS
jgi:hypothetical protein